MTDDEKKVFMNTYFTAITLSRGDILDAFGGENPDDEPEVKLKNDEVKAKLKGMSDDAVEDYISNYYREIFCDDIVETFNRYMKKTQ